ncbi:copper chaperone PCu(A)C [Cypionkella sp.]|uniref:copper chaperone PCu(A)C n=1 Tax=Cypionkella sp. TaxID=2811411 RepID=UPI002727FD86|nr:copper chaperone PCu(A)C [Cypionkella sp.]MDO8984420.1 copper chaperone PCu(A)C [Cypionkella sp.]MDP1577076.1 copper chaperone PCu(A)C [Cypionkella sp.]MDP2048101.1 copper chaperone PCu(A)C [Cypionkella sp.]
MKILIPALMALMSATQAFACGGTVAGNIEIENPWSRASIGTDRPGVVYLTIRNIGPAADMLTSIATPVADMPMLHETVVTDGIASMPHVMAVSVPAKGAIALEPGGFHAMLMGLTQKLEKGATFPVTLTFRDAGAVTVDVEIRGLGAKGPEC